MSTAYLVCGPESSGNRLVASILCRSGCGGEGSTRQPQRPADLPPARGPYALIKHHRLPLWIASLRAIGYGRVCAVMPLREPVAQTRSAVDRGHEASVADARAKRASTIRDNVRDAYRLADQVELLTYEGLSEAMLREWLPLVGLRYVAGPLQLDGQLAPPVIEPQNERHYLPSPSRQPAVRPRP